MSTDSDSTDNARLRAIRETARALRADGIDARTAMFGARALVDGASMARALDVGRAS